MWISLLLPAAAHAAEDNAWAGDWTLWATPEATQHTVEVAVDKTLATYAFPIRVLARPRLIAASTFCTRYRMQVSPLTFTNQCDGRSSITAAFDQPPGAGVSSDGRAYTVTVHRDDAQIELVFQSDEGWQRTRYRPGEGLSLSVEKTLHSAQLACDVTWTMLYRRSGIVPL